MPVKKNSKLAKKIQKPSEKENRILKNENKFLNATIDELKNDIKSKDEFYQKDILKVQNYFKGEQDKNKEIIEKLQKGYEEKHTELTNTQQQFKKLMLQIQQPEQQQPEQQQQSEQSGSFLTKKIMDLTPQEVIEGARVVKELVNPSTPVDPMQQVYLEFGKQVVGDTLTQLSKNVFAKKVATEQSQTIREATTGVQ